MPQNKGKGKSKATDTNPEVAPLLGSLSQTYHTEPLLDDEQAQPRSRTSRIGSILFTIIIVLFTLIIAAILFLVLLAASYKPSPSELSSLPKTAFAYSPPESISVLNVTDDGILVNITLRCGIDADQALGVKALSFDTPQEKSEAERRGERGLGAGWWENLRRFTAHKALSRLQRPSVSVHIPTLIDISSPNFKSLTSSPSILSVNVLDELEIPLIWDIPNQPQPPNSQPEWLQPISFRALAKPIASTGELWQFAQQAWAQGSVKVVIDINRVVARPSDNAWWAKYAEIEKEDLTMEIKSPIPRLPHLPEPGRPLNLSELVTLQHYSFDTSQSSDALKIQAVATVPNFAPNYNATLDFSLPFSIALPATDDSLEESKMAEVITEPVIIGGVGKDIELRISGVITANLSERSLSSKSVNVGSSPLSLLLQNYLHGKDNPITVQGLSSIPKFVPKRSILEPPNWLLNTLPSLSLSLNFPGPKPKPKIIESVTIDHMRISESQGKMKASGVVIAQIELPKDMQNVKIDVVEVLPDVLVFDGPSPEDDDFVGDDEENFPPKAFGHIRPLEYLNSTTSISGDPNYPNRLIVSAPLNQVDLNILPGRDSILSEFVSKIVFKGGALAGVKGIASVGVKIIGVNGKVRLDNLPVRGEFWVGRQKSSP
ncbi:uncharacterized protein L201_000533 [Kwoniella dendrophila CBS 6074]|uniref:Pre-rRNA processing protein n=1 Tax=Kwoniella dendrophila CBS 6074 TaxID=1295534 RepID=A0AAX4JJT4_9TREE